eukprot:scaffold572_cov229-Amphora_coffeaeformis.AAC.2
MEAGEAHLAKSYTDPFPSDDTEMMEGPLNSVDVYFQVDPDAEECLCGERFCGNSNKNNNSDDDSLAYSDDDDDDDDSTVDDGMIWSDDTNAVVTSSLGFQWFFPSSYSYSSSEVSDSDDENSFVDDGIIWSDDTNVIVTSSIHPPRRSLVKLLLGVLLFGFCRRKTTEKSVELGMDTALHNLQLPYEWVNDDWVNVELPEDALVTTVCLPDPVAANTTRFFLPEDVPVVYLPEDTVVIKFGSSLEDVSTPTHSYSGSIHVLAAHLVMFLVCRMLECARRSFIPQWLHSLRGSSSLVSPCPHPSSLLLVRPPVCVLVRPLACAVARVLWCILSCVFPLSLRPFLVVSKSL